VRWVSLARESLGGYCIGVRPRGSLQLESCGARLPAMRPCTTFGLQQTLAQAPGVIADFEEKIAALPGAGEGALFSELLFLQATLADARPRRILESGRGRGVVTSLLAACFPELEIISVERAPFSADAPFARTNLAAYNNVRCVTGDTRQMLPELVAAGDAVVINGPKDFGAVRLALSLARSGKPCAVFIHGCHRGSVAREFLSAAVPTAFYSDDEAFVKRFAYLDIRCWDRRKGARDGFDAPYQFRGASSSYGPTLACIPGTPELNFPWLEVRLGLAAFRHRFGSGSMPADSAATPPGDHRAHG
jgi:hypothetical protein